VFQIHTKADTAYYRELNMKAGTLFDDIEKNSILYADNKFYAFHGTLKTENPVYKIPILDLILNYINLVYSLTQFQYLVFIPEMCLPHDLFFSHILIKIL
jgi:hypothetical protein